MSYAQQEDLVYICKILKNLNLFSYKVKWSKNDFFKSYFSALISHHFLPLYFVLNEFNLQVRISLMK